MRGRALGVLAVLALGALCMLAPSASAANRFRPRIGHAFGLVPPAGRQELASGTNIPVVYHGGSVMRNVTVHTIFWAPNGFSFQGPPPTSTHGYKELIQQFLSDAAHDAGANSNVFSVLPQFGDRAGQGVYDFQYSAAANSINDTNPYPQASQQCASPAGIVTCITDLQLEQEVDSVAGGARGLGNIWLVYLPPNVDTCVAPGACGSNAFGGYHSAFNLGHGTTIYANMPDPLIETTIPPGSDPQGNPDAETAADVTAHELVEAFTDPQGTGWMDPNGGEVGDKCQIGPVRGTPLGFAANGSPYNQLLNGNQYFVQAMWSNSAAGCVQASSATNSPLPLAQVRLTQFGSGVSGRLPTPKGGVAVVVSLVRAGVEVARARTSTSSDGTWAVNLQSRSRNSLHGVGDDRDEIDVLYGQGGPRNDLILTGDGGNPFTQSGWTGWYALDNGYTVLANQTRGVIALAPCSQTGVLRLTIDGAPTRSPIDACETEADASIVRTGPLGGATAIGLNSTDNRAVSPANPDGALVALVLGLGEPNSASSRGNPLIPISPSGFPTCTGDLQDGLVRCSGLVPGGRYSLTRARGGATLHADADANGSLRAGGFGGSQQLRGGDLVRLRNGAGRTLTLLHLAHLRVHIDGNRTDISSGSCEPGDYYGQPLTQPPANAGIGHGPAGTGTVCPLSGGATGLSALDIEQTDDLGGGQTRTEVPQILDTAPSQDATVYGRFIALAGAATPGPSGSSVPSSATVSLTITRGSSRHVVFRAANVNTARGVAVHGLAAGVYDAKWLLTDANGDTRTVLTRFVEV